MFFKAVTFSGALAVAAGSLNAQELELSFTKRTTTELGGSLGDLMRLMPGGNDARIERVFISVPAKTMRTDNDDQSTIVDYASGDITSVNHDEEWWMRFNFRGMMGGPMSAGAAPQGMPPGYQPPTPPPGAEEPTYETRISVEQTGRTKEVLGFLTRETLIRVDLIPIRAPEGHTIEEMPHHVIVTSMWMADNFPGSVAMRELSEEIAEQMFGDDAEALGQAFAMNSALSQAYQENAEELAKIDGMSLEQMISFSTLVAGAEFDLDAALGGDLGDDRGIDLMGLAAGAAASGIEQAARSRLGRLGRFGRRSEPEPEPEARPEPQQLVLFRLHEVLTEFNEGSLPTGWNTVPEGYEERESPFVRRN